MVNLIRFHVLTCVLIMGFLNSPLALGETTRHTRSSTTTTVDTDDNGPNVVPGPPAEVPPPPPRPAGAGAYFESTLSQTFGSKASTGMAGCKTEALSKDIIKDLKRECAVWVKEQKADLGKNYLGNTCEDECDDCGMNLVRCKVAGTIRYRKPVDASYE